MPVAHLIRLGLLLGLLAPPLAAEVRLGSEVLPTAQAIRLHLDPAAESYHGSVVVELTVHRPTASLRFHARDMELSGLVLQRLDGTTAFGNREIVPVSQETADRGLVTLRAAAPLAAGTYRLAMDFARPFGTQAVGLYKVKKEGKSYAFTQFETSDARRAFPCWDEPGVKIPYQLTVEVPADHLAVGNTPVAGETAAAGWKTVTFAPTPPLPAYLLALATGPLESTPIPGLRVPGRVITVAGEGRLAGAAVALTPPLLAALERWFDQPYPMAKLDLIAVPEFWPGAMENPGAITFADNILLLDPAASSDAGRRNLALVTAHELAHQWFGDLVTLAWWDDLWLNESFADWMGDKITDQVFPEWSIGTGRLDEVSRLMARDARPSSLAVRRPVADPEDVVQNVGVAYAKGKAVLHMFELHLGAKVFRQGINDYLRRHAWGNATASDLWQALGQAAGHEVGSAMSSFLDQPGIPAVGVELLAGGAGGRIVISQQRFVSAGTTAPALAWQIPIGLKYSDGRTVRTQNVLLTSARQEVTLAGIAAGSAVAWVMPNLAGAGYYRWLLPAEMLRRLATDARAHLDVRERIQYLANLSALLSSGRVDGGTFLAATGAFAADADPLVAGAVIDRLREATPALVPDELAAPFAAFLRRTFQPVLARIGRAAQPGESSLVAGLRVQLLLLLGDEGRDPQILGYGAELAQRHLADPRGGTDEIADTALHLAAIGAGAGADRALYAQFRQRFERARTPTDRALYLHALSYFRSPGLRAEILAYLLNGPLRPAEIVRAMATLGSTEAALDEILAWVSAHYAEITAKIPPVQVPALSMLAGGCSTSRLEAARQFFSAPGHDAPGTAATLDRMADQVSDCRRLQEREKASVAAFLARSANDPPAQNGLLRSRTSSEVRP